MIHKVMFVGCGQAGSKIADIAKKNGSPVLYLNLSANDLRALEYAEDYEKFLIRGDGAGKDREYAKKMLDVGGVVNFFHEHLRNREIKIVNFVFATGGGSGSGITPVIIDVLRYEFPEIIFMAMPILPDLNESYISQVNTIDAVQELSELMIPVFPIDNRQVNMQSRYKSYDYINNQAVHLFYKLFDYTQMDSKNQFDETDLLKILSEVGNGIITEIELASINANLTSEGITKAIQQSWSKSIFAPIDMTYVSKVVVIFDGQVKLLDCIDTEMIFDVFNNKPMYVFNGIYNNGNGTVITVLTGLPWCKDRLDQIEHQIKVNKEKYNTLMSDDSKHRYRPSESVSEAVSLIGQSRQQSTTLTKPNWRDLLNKYRK